MCKKETDLLPSEQRTKKNVWAEKEHILYIDTRWVGEKEMGHLKRYICKVIGAEDRKVLCGPRTQQREWHVILDLLSYINTHFIKNLYFW